MFQAFSKIFLIAGEHKIADPLCLRVIDQSPQPVSQLLCQILLMVAAGSDDLLPVLLLKQSIQDQDGIRWRWGCGTIEIEAEVAVESPGCQFRTRDEQKDPFDGRIRLDDIGSPGMCGCQALVALAGQMEKLIPDGGGFDIWLRFCFRLCLCNWPCSRLWFCHQGYLRTIQNLSARIF